jgi:hypothetical protein
MPLQGSKWMEEMRSLANETKAVQYAHRSEDPSWDCVNGLRDFLPDAAICVKSRNYEIRKEYEILSCKHGGRKGGRG